MPRGSQQTREQREAMIQGIALGLSATAIYKDLERRGLLSEPHPPFDIRTVQRQIKKLKGESRGPQEAWTLKDDPDPETANPVLRILWTLSQQSDVIPEITFEFAEWIKRVASAAPSLPPELLFACAWGYMTSVRRGLADTRVLDLVLAMYIELSANVFTNRDLDPNKKPHEQWNNPRLEVLRAGRRRIERILTSHDDRNEWTQLISDIFSLVDGIASKLHGEDVKNAWTKSDASAQLVESIWFGGRQTWSGSI